MRIHPLIAGAAAGVIVLSGVGVAAITGVLPGTRAEKAADGRPGSRHRGAHARRQAEKREIWHAPGLEVGRQAAAAGREARIGVARRQDLCY